MSSRRFPHSLVLISLLVVLAQVATFVLPAGSFEREPRPAAGSPWSERAGEPPLRSRLAASRNERGLSEAGLARLLHVSEGTVRGWESGPPQPGEAWRAGTHIEQRAGELLDAWVRTGVAPGDEAILAWKTAAGGRQRVVPGSYRELQREATGDGVATALGKGAAGVLTAVPKGLASAADIIFFVLLVGGVVAILRRTGAIDALIGAAIRGLGGRPVLLVAGMVTLLALGSSTIGMAEEYMPFVPILVTMCLLLKLDAIVALAIVYVGAGLGYGAAAINPFTVLIAQDIAGLEPTSGWAFRCAMLAAFLVVGVHHILRYAARIRRDPGASLVHDVDYSQGYEMPDDVALTARRVLVVLVFLLGVVVFVYGVAVHGWYFTELNAVFLAIGLLAAVLGGLGPNRTAEAFCAGAAEMTATALLIGFARTIEVVLTDGEVIDTVIAGIASVLQAGGSEVAATGMLVVQSVCNFFIPSGSGQAYVTMPIMAPLADLTGVSRQTAVLAYQLGDGLTNTIVPTNALLMGMLALARIPYQRWLRFIVPLLVKIYALAIVFLVIAVQVGY